LRHHDGKLFISVERGETKQCLRKRSLKSPLSHKSVAWAKQANGKLSDLILWDDRNFLWFFII